MTNPTYISDGDEIAIMATPELRYASVFLSVDKRRIGVRLEQCRSFGKPYVIWVATESATKFSEAFAEIARRLA